MRIANTLIRRFTTLAAGLAGVTAAVCIAVAMFVTPLNVALPGVSWRLAPGAGEVPYVILAVVLLVVGAVLVVASVSPARRHRRSIPLRLPQSPVGGLEVTMSPHALLSLLRYEAFRVPGVTELRGSVDVGESGWEVACDVESNRDTPVRAMVDALDERLRSGLLLHTGVPLAHLSIDVRPTAHRANTLR
jgi:hypothetical protein